MYSYKGLIMNKIILIEEPSFGEPDVLIFNNERDIEQYFKDFEILITSNNVKVRSRMGGITTEYKLIWGKYYG